MSQENERCHERHREYCRKWRQTHKEQLREYNKKYRTTEKYKKKHREYYKHNSKKHNEYTKKWREQNKDHVKEYTRKYYLLHKKEKNVDRMNRFRELKQKYVNLLGGKCQICGYNKDNGALHFHHLNPDEKERTKEALRVAFEPKIRNGSIQLLCANCHQEIHDGFTNELKETVKRLGIEDWFKRE
jgi:gas vesicle protein